MQGYSCIFVLYGENMNTKYSLTLNNGKEVNLSLNFALLYKLRAEHKDIYDKYMKIKNNLKSADDLDTVYILYTAYCCENPDCIIDFVEFLQQVPPDNAIVYELFGKLISPSKMNKGFRPGVQKGNRKNKQ